jgi:3'-5' exoribonuclease
MEAVATPNNRIVLVQRLDVRKTRKGDDFATLMLNLGRPDGFATIEGKIWQYDRFVDAGGPLPTEGAALEVTYRPDEYQGRPQWTIQRFRVLEGSERAKALEEFVPPTKIDEAFYQRRLEELMEQTDSERVSAKVLSDIFDRAEFRAEFFHSPAAISRHQHYPGGLLEHTLNVTTLALALADAYAGENREGLTLDREKLTVDRTLLISAGLLHDIGKLETYKLSPLSEGTDANRFEGHLSISYARVREVAWGYREKAPYEDAADEIDKLLNCILSHHGQLEYGSPVLPCCVEAFILSQADLTDARLAMIVNEGNRALRQNRGLRWIRPPHFGHGLFVGDWPDPPKA